FHRYGADQGIVGTVGVLQASRLGGTWFSSQGGYVALFRDGLARTWKIADDPRLGVQQILEESASELLVRLNYHVYRLELNTGSVTLLEVPRDEIGYGSFFKEQDGTMWLCSGAGIWQGKDGHWSQVTTALPQMPPWPDHIYR